jgi:ribosomal protein S18 acetylase RimI-like enzyme
MGASPQITRLDPSAVPQAAPVQARAFFDDPGFAFTFPDEPSRPERLTWLMQVGISYGAKYGHVSTTAGQMVGHAVWLPPGDTSISDERLAEFGFAEAPEAMGALALERFGGFMELMGVHHERLMPEPHWYLMILGVEPDRQGEGIGSSLIASTLTQADAGDLPCYLETAKEKNLAFYRRHGFEVAHEDDIPGGGPRVWMMKRPRRSSRGS